MSLPRHSKKQLATAAMKKTSILDLKDLQIGQLSGATTAFLAHALIKHADLLDELKVSMPPSNMRDCGAAPNL